MEGEIWEQPLTPEKEAEYKRKYIALLKEIKQEFPNFSIIQKKTSNFSQMLQRLSPWNTDLNLKYDTTIGPKIYVCAGKESGPRPWKKPWNQRTFHKRYDMLIHERIHQRQVRDCGGLIPFFFLFGLVPLPAKLAWFRKRFEAEAYQLSIFMVMKEFGKDVVLSPADRKYILDQFYGKFYMYMWYSQKQIMNWLEKTVIDVEEGRLTETMLLKRRKRPNDKRKLDIPRLLKLLYPEEFRR